MFTFTGAINCVISTESTRTGLRNVRKTWFGSLEWDESEEQAKKNKAEEFYGNFPLEKTVSDA